MSLLRDKFISFLQLKGFTKATIRNYIQSIKQFQDWLGKSPVHVTRDSAHLYLAYTHRVAISDARIVEHDRESVSFSYKDYAHENERKIMTLAASEFVRRFLLHVLPQGFKKIRYFGFLAPRARLFDDNYSCGVATIRLKVYKNILNATTSNCHSLDFI